MDPTDKIDLTSVNKTKKQFKLPKLSNPFKKNSAGPGRDQYGQFASGSGGLLSSKKLKLSRILPLALVVALVGGFLVFRSFAGTYSACFQNNGSYIYDEQCVTDSDEASVVRLFYGIFNRAPDKAGLDYWTNKLSKKTVTVTEIARQFMGSSEFKSKYGTLSDQAFVKAMYPQVFGRNPDSGGLTYWTNRLASKKITRQGLMVQFTQSSEMKSKFSTRVAAALGISQQSYSRKINAFTSANIKCYGTVVTDAAGKWCQINANQTGSAVFSAQVTDGIIKDDASYVICYDVATTGVDNTTHQFALFAKQLQNSVNDATLVENINGGGGVVPLNGKSCLNYTDTKDKIKSFLAYVISKDQTANSLVKVNLDTLYLGQVLNQDSGFLQKQPNAQTTQGAGGPIKLGTQTKNTAYTVHSVQSDSTKTQPYLAHTTEFFSGKKSVLGLECEPGYGKQATVRATVTNVDTGEKLTNSELEFVEYDSSDNQYIRRFKPEQNITLPSSLSYYAAPDISFKTESTKPIRAKVALTIVNGNCSATNSSRGYNFWWSYQN